ncbi:folylpolyglutamate synthase/dihydrofolate synthase family protein [soil metagenome]
MTYEQTLHYLYNKLPLYSKVGRRAYKADLKNTIALCKFLGNPERKLKCVHIAGTNGKGSTSHMLAAIYQQAGYKTGLYTSPHLWDFRERIKVNGEMISESFVINFVEEIREFSEEINPSFFELTFAMALAFFADAETDIAIIETGLGGRLDSTNIITPELSIITNIGYDHMDILGDSLEKIAFEKAGIIKQNIPVLAGESNEITKPVFLQKSQETSSEIFFSENLFEVKLVSSRIDQLLVAAENKMTKQVSGYSLDLNGHYQQKNVRTALAAIQTLQKKFPVEEEIISNALSKVKTLTGLFGRWEVIETSPMVVLDVAHNKDGFAELLEQVKLIPHQQLHIIIGLVKDKRIENVLALLPLDAIYYFTRAQIPRALPEKDLKDLAMKYGLTGEIFPDVNQAIHASKLQAGVNDLILVCGSVFVIGEVEMLMTKHLTGDNKVL